MSAQKVWLWGVSFASQPFSDISAYNDYWYPVIDSQSSPWIIIEQYRQKSWIHRVQTSVIIHMTINKAHTQFRISHSDILEICVCTKSKFQNSPFLRHIILILKKQPLQCPSSLSEYFTMKQIPDNILQLNKYNMVNTQYKVCYVSLYMNLFNLKVFINILTKCPMLLHIISNHNGFPMEIRTMSQTTNNIWTGSINHSEIYSPFPYLKKSLLYVATLVNLPTIEDQAVWVFPAQGQHRKESKHWITKKMVSLTNTSSHAQLNGNCLNFCLDFEYSNWSSLIKDKVYIISSWRANDLINKVRIFDKIEAEIVELKNKNESINQKRTEMSKLTEKILRLTNKTSQSIFKEILIFPYLDIQKLIKHWILFIFGKNDELDSQFIYTVYVLESLNKWKVDHIFPILIKWLNIHAKKKLFIKDQNINIIYISVPTQDTKNNCGWYLLMNIYKFISDRATLNNCLSKKQKWYCKHDVNNYIQNKQRFFQQIIDMQQRYFETFKLC